MSGSQQKSSLRKLSMDQSSSAEVESNRRDSGIKDEVDRAGNNNVGRQNQVDEREQEEDRPQDPKDTTENGEEEMECGFCLFMKGGGCKEEFIAWEKCVEEAEKNKEDIVEACFKITDLMKKCMDAHADYYEPILRAEKAMEEEAGRALDQEDKHDAASTSQSTHDS